MGTFIGILLFLACVAGAVWYIKEYGKSGLAEWLREKWPTKKA